MAIIPATPIYVVQIESLILTLELLIPRVHSIFKFIDFFASIIHQEADREALAS